MSALAMFEKQIVRPRPGRTLIVGSKVYRDKEDRRKRYSAVVGVDMLEGDGVDVVCDLEDVLDVQEKFKRENGIVHFHHVECMSTLEHSRRPWLMAENIEALMAPGASIFVSVPFCWRVHAYPDDYWRLTPSGLRSIFPNIEWARVMIAAERLMGERDRLTAVKSSDHPFMARAETVGFGYRK